MVKHTLLKSSLAQLNAITNEAYHEDIRQVALNLWEKHLQPKNPQWKFLTAKPFYLKNKDGSAHVMAMVDKRLPEIGIVGYFACTNSAVGAQVLKQSADWLKEEYGLKDIYGPINGTLPSDYRLNLRDSFCFPGEPVNPTWHIDAFHEAGFNVFNRYVSGISQHYQLLMKLVIRKPKKGYENLTVRSFNNKKFKQDFKKYHDLRNAIFPFQSIYCPAISLEERVYNSSGKFDPNYTYFLVDKRREVGFIMAYAHEGRLILKTIGLLPEYRGKRLSGLLLKPIHDQASKQDLKTAVYGMVRVGNAAYKMKRPGVRVFRKYVTMHKSV
jgi:hypothetical protein